LVQETALVSVKPSVSASEAVVVEEIDSWHKRYWRQSFQ
jgi:hypothetical protein